MSDQLQFEWDDNNLRHVLEERPHGVTPTIVDSLINPKFYANVGVGRSGSHMMIALDETGRFWTVIVLDKGGNVWRPITGWPSTEPQIQLYQETE